MRLWLALASAGALAALTAACAGLPGAASEPPQMTASTSVARGQAIAQNMCASCHAIGREGASPRAEARPFRTITALYPIDALEEAFAEGITVGHPEMPAFRFEPDEIQDLLAYLQSIQEGPSPSPN